MLWLEMQHQSLSTTVDKRSDPSYNKQVIKRTPMQDDYLTRCVVDPVARKFYLYSEQGEERVVDCETVDQFMAVLELVRDKCDEDTLAYANPL